MELVLVLLLSVFVALLWPRNNKRQDPPPPYYPTPLSDPQPTGVLWTRNGPVLYYDGERPGQEEPPVWHENWRRGHKQADTDV